MTLRHRAGRTLRSVIGPERAASVARWEKNVRRSAARKLEPAAPPRPAAKKATAAKAKPAGPRRLPSDPFAEFPEPTQSRHELLTALHAALTPRTYLEVGVNNGKSLALSRTRTIGVDPEYAVAMEIQCDVQLLRTTSDEFFARPDAVAFFDGTPIDLAFIDGMHLSEYALRDFINAEKLMAPTGVILLDDMLPRNALEAARDRRTRAWAGDVFKVADVLRKRRPDLTVISVNTAPTGTVLVLGLDPTSRVLDEHYDEDLAFCLAGDPQAVPDDTLHRTHAVDPVEIMTSDVWSRLVALRDGSGSPAELTAALSDLRA